MKPLDTEEYLYDYPGLALFVLPFSAGWPGIPVIIYVRSILWR
jgi:hypothetical protein